MDANTKFADMPSGIAAHWKQWARSHDWGRGAYYEEGRMHGIIETSYDASDKIHEEEVSFSTPREMRDWAGY
jgi:hypothetical protein